MKEVQMISKRYQMQLQAQYICFWSLTVFPPPITDEYSLPIPKINQSTKLHWVGRS